LAKCLGIYKRYLAQWVLYWCVCTTHLLRNHDHTNQA